MTTAYVLAKIQEAGIECNHRAYRSSTRGIVLVVDCFRPEDRQRLIDYLAGESIIAKRIDDSWIYGNRPNVRIVIEHLTSRS